MSTLRAQLRKALEGVLPERYALRPNALPLEGITKPTIQIKQLGMEPAAEAPQGCLAVDFVLTLASPLTAPQRAEDQLDDDVTELCAALDRLPGLNWTRAEKVVAGAGEQYLAYDVTMTVQTTLNPTRPKD